MTFQLLTAALLLLGGASPIWPPPYKINLTQKEDFVIFETFEDEDEDEEMIKADDARAFGIERDKVKYFRIHQMAMRRRAVPAKAPAKRPQRMKWAERNYEKEEGVPWIAGFFENESDALQENSNVFYLNEMAKSLIETKINADREREFFASTKRKRKSDEAKPPDYDYHGFKAEYVADVEREKSSNLTLSFVEAKEEESFKDAFKNIVNIKTAPRNCTKEETSGIGLAAVECYWIDLHKDNAESQKTKLWKGILKIVVLWFCMYLIIAIPCWCQKGWCCCCFQCRFCKPLVRIDEIKKYMADNPVGTYNHEGKITKYKPSHYEKYAQKRLEQALMKL